MLEKLRSNLTFANVMASIAVFLALGGGAYAASIAPKNSVVSSSIRDGQVKTQDLRDGAVKPSKLAINSVAGAHIQDDTVTGFDVVETSLRFKCKPNIENYPAGTQGPFQIRDTGFCALVLHPSSARTWSQAANDCSTAIPDSTLADPAQIAQLQASAGGSQGPLAGTTGIWTAGPAGASSIWTVQVGNGGTVSGFTAVSMTTPSSGPIACVYEPSSANG